MTASTNKTQVADLNDGQLVKITRLEPVGPAH